MIARLAPALVALVLLPAQAMASDGGCLAKAGTVGVRSIRNVRVGAQAQFGDGAAHVSSVSYCVEGGGTFSFALDPDERILLAASTAAGDAIGTVHPGGAAPPKAQAAARSGSVEIDRVAHRQIVYGVAGGRVTFVAAADELLLESPGKLAYWARRLSLV